MLIELKKINKIDGMAYYGVKVDGMWESAWFVSVIEATTVYDNMVQNAKAGIAKEELIASETIETK